MLDDLIIKLISVSGSQVDLLFGLLQHVVAVPTRDRDESDGLGIISDFLDECRRLLHNFIEPIFAPLKTIVRDDLLAYGAGGTHLGGIHLVDSHDQLPYTESVGQKSMLASLAILGNTSFELTSTTGNDENGTISLRGTSNHIFNEITVTGGIDDLCCDDLEKGLQKFKKRRD